MSVIARSSRRSALALAAIAAALCGACGEAGGAAGQGQIPDEPTRVLRVCADPNNLPFSNAEEEGFENRIAALLAAEMGARLRYTWWAQRRGFVRNTLRAGECDLVAGVPSSYELVLATRPYYRSSYVFVYPADAGYAIESLDDPVLGKLRLGVHLLGDDYANTPPSHALARRGIIDNVRGYSMYDDYGAPDPPARIFEALARGEIDVAIVWGPFAGYFAPRQPMELEIVPVSPQVDLPFLPFVYDVAMGVRREDTVFRGEIDGILRRRSAGIDSILAEFGVPRLDATGLRAAAGGGGGT